MLKIFIVMLTTAVFAGMLIARPYEMPSHSGMAEAARFVTATGPAQPGPEQAQPVSSQTPNGQPAPQPDTELVASGQPAPALAEPVLLQQPVQQANVETLLQRVQVHGRRTPGAYRVAHQRNTDAANRANGGHHTRRHG